MIIKTTLRDYLNNPSLYKKEFLDIDYIRIASCNRKIRHEISRHDIPSRAGEALVAVTLFDTNKRTQISLSSPVNIYYKADGTFKEPVERYPYYESESLAYKMRDYKFKNQ